MGFDSLIVLVYLVLNVVCVVGLMLFAAVWLLVVWGDSGALMYCVVCVLVC